MSKCCFIDFKEARNKNAGDNAEHTLYIKGTKIKQVPETKFLGVTIDENLNWNAHINNLAKKLSCCTGVINSIKDNIPADMYNSIYHTLFESHLAYGITVWGGVSNKKLETLFKIQKTCMRILFGDKEAYLDKFKTCARTREIGEQKLGANFYKREHTKPLFNAQSLINVRNLYVYHCGNEMFKILKFRTPMSIFELFQLSDRTGRETLLLTPSPSDSFLYHGCLIWNVVRDLVKLYDFNSRNLTIKSVLKKKILETQREGDSIKWESSTSWNSIDCSIYNH